MRTEPKFWSLIRAADGQSAELRISGDIVDDNAAWFYEWLDMPCTAPNGVRAQLAALGGAPLTVWIDSCGGDVKAAAAIYTALMEYRGETTAKIEGAAYSAASVIAMACNRVLMSPAATMMIHLPWTEATGNEHEMRQAADVLGEVGETLINAYEIKSGLPRARIRALLEAGTWMGAKKAMELGFADGMLYDMDSEPAQAAVIAQARAIYAFKRPAAPPAADDWTEWAAGELALAKHRTEERTRT